jgi:hypothetical protein
LSLPLNQKWIIIFGRALQGGFLVKIGKNFNGDRK